MTETTTIQITTDQREALEARKLHDDESIKTVIARLLDTDDSADADEIADAVVADLRASLPADVAEELATELR
jgi:hypothetical protein